LKLVFIFSFVAVGASFQTCAIEFQVGASFQTCANQ